MTQFLIIVGMGVCCFLPRYLPLALFRDREMPALLNTFLNHTPMAVLTALVVPALLSPSGKGVEWTLSNPYLIGGVATFVAGLISKKFLLVTAIGITVFYLSRWLLS